MNRAQDEEFARQYWQPSKKAAAEAGIKSALGYAILYDTRVQGGMQEVIKRARVRLGGKVGDVATGKEITEQEFLRAFVDERIKRHLRISAHQRNQAEDLSKQADALEEQAALAEPDRAEELKRQAADKRKKAKQYASNAAALEISANKTRGPSLLALVDSGDLNLYDQQERRIYLKGKPGVAIESLTPGAEQDRTVVGSGVVVSALRISSRSSLAGGGSGGGTSLKCRRSYLGPPSRAVPGPVRANQGPSLAVQPRVNE